MLMLLISLLSLLLIPTVRGEPPVKVGSNNEVFVDDLIVKNSFSFVGSSTNTFIASCSASTVGASCMGVPKRERLITPKNADLNHYNMAINKKGDIFRATYSALPGRPTHECTLQRFNADKAYEELSCCLPFENVYAVSLDIFHETGEFVVMDRNRTQVLLYPEGSDGCPSGTPTVLATLGDPGLVFNVTELGTPFYLVWTVHFDQDTGHVRFCTQKTAECTIITRYMNGTYAAPEIFYKGNTTEEGYYEALRDVSFDPFTREIFINNHGNISSVIHMKPLVLEPKYQEDYEIVQTPTKYLPLSMSYIPKTREIIYGHFEVRHFNLELMNIENGITREVFLPVERVFIMGVTYSPKSSTVVVSNLRGEITIIDLFNEQKVSPGYCSTQSECVVSL